MMRFSLVSVLAALACGQQAAFVTSDVRPSTDAGWVRSGPVIWGERYQIRNFTMLDLIVEAYRVPAWKVVAGPSWLAWDRFDITASMPRGSGPDEARLQLQSLLAGRFRLVMRREERQVPAFGLMAGTKSKLTRAEGNGASGCRKTATATMLHMCRNMTMEEFTAELGAISSYVGDRAVVDLTELKGRWDFEFRYSPSLSAAGRITLFDAMDGLGLHLAPVHVAESVLVVESVSEKPTENMPGAAEALSARVPAEFEAASVRASVPGSVSESMQYLPGGRFNAANMPLLRLISSAFDVPENRIDGPDWIGQERFTIVARAPTGVEMPDAADKATRSMLKALLIQHFSIATHWETRHGSGLKLIAVKPKLRHADPSERTSIVNGPWDRSRPGIDTKDPRLATPVRDTLITYQNMTMAQIAANFVRAGVHDVRDATGLRGSWDMTLNYTSLRPSGLNIIDADGNPTGGLTFEEALERQAGLKIMAEDRMVRVLVIDRIERLPAEN